MNGITHKQAKRFIHAELDGLLTDAQRHDLEVHLRECEACRAESESLSVLTARLRSNFQGRWDAQDGPSQKVMANIHSQTRRIIMSNRIRFGLRTLAGICVLVVLGFLINFAFSQLLNPSITVSGIDATNGVIPEKQLPLIAFTSDQNGNSEIYIVHTDGTGLTNLTNDPAIDTGSYWSPEGNRIAFMSNRDGNDNLYVMNFDGSNVIQLTNDLATEISPVWSPDGRKIAYASGSLSDQGSINHTNIYVVDVDSKNVNQVTYYTPDKFVWPQAWSLDSQYIFFGVDRQIAQVGADGGDVTPITKHTEEGIPLNITLSEDGPSLLYLGGYGTIQCEAGSFCFMLNSIGMDGTNYKNLATLKTPELCKPKQTSSDKRSWRKWSPDRTKILFYFGCEDAGWIYIANADGSDFQPLTIGNKQNLGFDGDWSPDSQSIVFTSTLDQAGNADIYTVNINDALADPSIHPTRITDAPSFDSFPAWRPSPNKDIAEEKPTPEPTQTSSYGGLIAFVSRQENGNAEIFTIGGDGTSLANLTNNPANDSSPAWSPDGNRLAFLSDRNGQWDLFSMKSDGSELTQLTDDEEVGYGFSWSPTGKQLAYIAVSTQDPKLQSIVIMNSDGSDVQEAIDGLSGGLINNMRTVDIYLNWSPDGSKLAFWEEIGQSDKDVKTKFYAVNADGIGLQELANVDGRIVDMRWEGNHIIALTNHLSATGERNWELYRLSMDGAPPQKLASHDKRIVNWFGDLPDLTYIVETGSATWTWFKTDGEDNTALNVWKNYFEDCRSYDIAQWPFSSLSPDRKTLIVSITCEDGSSWLYLVNSDGSEITHLTAEPISEQVMPGTWSSDGKYLVFEAYALSSVGFDYYILNVADALADPTNRPKRLTSDGTNDKGGAIFQPISNLEANGLLPTPELTQTSSYDGLIAFASEKSGNFEIYTMQADGSNITELTQGTAKNYGPAWSPDGKKIAFVSERTGNSDVFVMNPDESNLTQLTDNPGYDGFFSWSPDGQKIVYISSDNSLNENEQLIS